jgi:hypothetical protein
MECSRSQRGGSEGRGGGYIFDKTAEPWNYWLLELLDLKLEISGPGKTRRANQNLDQSDLSNQNLELYHNRQIPVP